MFQPLQQRRLGRYRRKGLAHKRCLELFRHKAHLSKQTTNQHTDGVTTVCSHPVTSARLASISLDVA